MAKKHDWERLKLEYLTGDEPCVEAFLRARGINPNGGYATLKTSGWARERRAVGEQALSHDRLVEIVLNSLESRRSGETGAREAQNGG